MKLKFQVFKDVARKMIKFLAIFQRDEPMVPFIDEVLANLMRTIMGCFVKISVLDEAVTTGQLIKIDLKTK